MKMSKLNMVIVALAVCLAVSLFFNGYLYFQNQLVTNEEEHGPTFFSFAFGPAMQNLVNGTLYLNLTFDVVEGNLTVKAEVNTESYNPYASLALQFDSDNNGTIDAPARDYRKDDLQFLLRANNYTRKSIAPYWGWYANGTIWCFSKMWTPTEFPSEFHYCYYNVAKGCYTFYFTFPIEPKEGMLWDRGTYGIQGKLVRVLYGIVPFDGRPAKGMSVYVPPFKFTEGE